MMQALIGEAERAGARSESTRQLAVLEVAACTQAADGHVTNTCHQLFHNTDPWHRIDAQLTTG